MSDDLNMAPQLTLTPEADAAAAAAPAAPEAPALTLDTAPEAAVQQASATDRGRAPEGAGRQRRQGGRVHAQ